MQSSLVISKGMAYNASRSETLSRNSFMVPPSTGGSNISPGVISTFAIPEGSSALDLHSVRLRFKITCTGPGGTVFAKCPPSFALIQRVELYSGGSLIDSACSEHQTVAHIQHLLKTSLAEDGAAGRSLHNSHMNIGAAHDVLSLVITGSQLSGFFNGSTRYFPASMANSLVLRVTWAPVSVLSAQGATPGTLTNAEVTALGTTPLNYSVDDLVMTMDACQFSETYTSLLQQRLMDTGVLPINYKSYYTFSNTPNTATSHTTSFSLAAASLDRLFAVCRDSQYSAVNKSVAQIQNHHTGPVATPNFLDFKTGDNGGLIDGDLSYNWKINSVMHPVFDAKVSDALANCFYTYDKRDNLIMSRQSFHDGQAIFPLTLCLPDSDVSSSASGSDSRGQNSALSFNITGQTAQTNGTSVLVVAETTTLLKILVGRNLTVAY